jgi:hypothetical protein
MRRIILLVLVFLFPGSSLFAFWPLSWDLDGQKNYLGPLISYEEEGDQTHVTLRPFLSSYDSPDNYTFLFPLGKSTEEKSYFVPFYMRHSGVGEHDTTLFPVFWGETGERSYGGVFPFYGRLYNRFRRDEIGFFFWPLYSYSVSDGSTRTNVLWLLFSFYSGYQEGFKIGPLYGQRRWGDERKATFVLWPFFIKDDKFINTDNPTRSVWAMPFYMQTKSPRSSFYAALWPFFTYMHVPDRTEIKAPWPIFSYTSGQTESGFAMWPLYSHSQSDADEVTYVLWPIYKEWERHPGDDKWTETRILLLDRYTVDDRGTFLNVWPFFEYRSTREEDRTFFFPSLLPWRNKDFDRIMRPMLTLYEFRKAGKKTVSNFMYGLYTKEEEGETWKRRLAFLLEVKREPESMGFQVLSGLFGLDARGVKVFYIPIKRKQAEEQAREQPREQAQEQSQERAQQQPQEHSE